MQETNLVAKYSINFFFNFFKYYECKKESI